MCRFFHEDISLSFFFSEIQDFCRLYRLFFSLKEVSLASLSCNQHCWIRLLIPRNSCIGENGKSLDNRRGGSHMLSVVKPHPRDKPLHEGLPLKLIHILYKEPEIAQGHQ